jgi:hypothetical protein
MTAAHRAVLIAAAVVLAACMPAAASAARGPIVINGASSWYGGPCDSQDNNRTASGIPNTVPGFATRTVPFRLWFVVTGPNGKRAIAQSIERGPAAWTRRVIDLNYTLAERLGYRAPRGCVRGYPNGAVRAQQIDIVRYPSCGWAAQLAVRQLRTIIGPLGRDDDCLKGTAADWMQTFQGWIGRRSNARKRRVDIEDWRVLYQAA